MDSGIAVVLQIHCRISSTVLVLSVTPVYLNNTVMLVLRRTSLERYVFLCETFAVENKLLLYYSDILLFCYCFNLRGVGCSRMKIQKRCWWQGYCMCLMFPEHVSRAHECWALWFCYLSMVKGHSNMLTGQWQVKTAPRLSQPGRALLTSSLWWL